MVKRTEMLNSLKLLVNQMESFTSTNSITFRIWRSEVSELLSQSFGVDSWQYKEFTGIDFEPSKLSGRQIYREKADGTQGMIAMSSEFASAMQDSQALLSKCMGILESSSINSEAFHTQSKQKDTLLRAPLVNEARGDSVSKKVFITHGRSQDWREVAAYLEREVKLATLELSQEANMGATVVEKLERYTPQCNFAVIVMTGDDTDSNGTPRVRENVMHEIGWFQAKYGRSNVCLLHENDVSIPTNISGIVYIGYPKGYINATFAQLRKEIEAVFN